MNIAQYIIEIASKGDTQAVSRIETVQKSLDAADRSATKLSNNLSKGLGQAFRSLPGAEFITNPIVALTAGVGVVSKLGMEAEKTAVAFNVLVGNEDKAAKMLAEMNKYADNTLWDRNTIQSAAQTMLGFGVSTESVVGDLKMLGDVAMGDKNRLRQLALVFGQISAAGKLQGQDLLQLINAGYNPLLDISEMTGKSVAQLKDEMSKGLITFDMVQAAFQRATGEGGKFNNMTERIAETSFGAFEQLKGKLVGALLALYNVIQPLVIPVLNVLGKGLEFLGNIASFASNNINTLMVALAALAAGLVTYNAVVAIAKLYSEGWTIATIAQYYALLLLEKGQKLVNLAMSMNPIGLIVAGIAALIAVVVVCWNKFAGFRAVVLTVWDTMKGFAQLLQQYVMKVIAGLIGGIGSLGEAIGKLFSGDFEGAWESARAGAAQLRSISAAGGAFVSSTRALGAGWHDNYAANLAAEQQRGNHNGISEPAAAGGVGADFGMSGGAYGSGAGSGSGGAGATANAITTGGTRNTSIVINIGKFFEDVNITNTENRSFPELRDAVLESVNRSLEIAVSAAR